MSTPTPQGKEWKLERLTPLQVFQRHLFDVIDEAAKELDPETLDALRQAVVARMDRVADSALSD